MSENRRILEIVQPGPRGPAGVDGISHLIPSVKTGNYTLTLADEKSAYIRMDSATPNSVTVPSHSDVAFPIGTHIRIAQAGIGKTILAAGAGVTLNSAESLNLRKRFSEANVKKIGSNEWDVSGDLEPLTAIPNPNPLRVISVQNRVNIGTDNVTGKTVHCFRWPHFIAANASELVVAFNNWVIGTGSEAGVGNIVTILECSIESPGGTIVPVRFSGARSKQMVADEAKLLSDAISASAFNLPHIASGTTYWIKGKVEVPSGGKIGYTFTQTADVSGSQADWIDPAASTISSTDSAGIYTLLSGAAFSSRPQGFTPMLFGKPLTDGKSLIVIGDSIASGTGDENRGIAGRGFVQRAAYNNGTNPIPCLNFGRASAQAAAFAGAIRWREFISYARSALDELITNDIGTSDTLSLATLQTRAQSIWSLLTAGGAEKILRTKLLVRTTSTDIWATAANQTETPGWTSGGKAQQFNSWLDTKKTDGGLWEVIPMNAIRDTALPTKWLTNGTTNYMNVDEVHPSATGHGLMATELRTALNLL